MKPIIKRDIIQLGFDTLCLFLLVFTLFWLDNPSILKGFDKPMIGFAIGVTLEVTLIRGVSLLADIFSPVFIFIIHGFAFSLRERIIERGFDRWIKYHAEVGDSLTIKQLIKYQLTKKEKNQFNKLDEFIKKLQKQEVKR